MLTTPALPIPSFPALGRHDTTYLEVGRPMIQHVTLLYFDPCILSRPTGTVYFAAAEYNDKPHQFSSVPLLRATDPQEQQQQQQQKPTFWCQKPPSGVQGHPGATLGESKGRVEDQSGPRLKTESSKSQKLLVFLLKSASLCLSRARGV